MNELQLSKRLETVASNIPKGSILADIGSDHAYLPCYAYLKGMIIKGVAGEVNEGPYRSAKEQVKKVGLEEKIEVRKGDGLAVIDPHEVSCITIAGMGGTLITSILEEGAEKLEGVSRLILQPNIGAINIRKWLIHNQWQVVDEKILEEDSKIYEIIVAEKGDPKIPYDDLDAGLLLGPILLKERNEAFIKKWQHEKKHWQRILQNMNQAEESEENRRKKEELHHMIQIVEGVLG